MTTMSRKPTSIGPILIGLGANLPSPTGGPRDTLEAAIRGLNSAGVLTLHRSRWFSSPAWPPSDQPPYVNAVISVATTLAPAALLAVMHHLEAARGRIRGERNAARPLDLDLLAYGDLVQAPEPGSGEPILPHPRLVERAFVLLPLAEVAPDWHHPVTGRSVTDLVGALGDTSETRPLE